MPTVLQIQDRQGQSAGAADRRKAAGRSALGVRKVASTGTGAKGADAGLRPQAAGTDGPYDWDRSRTWLSYLRR